MEIPMQFYLFVGAVMFFAGIYGFITRRNLLAILISLELILNAVNINFVVFNRYLYPDALEGYFFTLFTKPRFDEVLTRPGKKDIKNGILDIRTSAPYADVPSDRAYAEQAQRSDGRIDRDPGHDGDNARGLLRRVPIFHNAENRRSLR